MVDTSDKDALKADVFKTVIQELQRLSEKERINVIAAVAVFFGVRVS